MARDKFLLTGELRASQDRVRELLHSILPSEIVGRIEAGEQSIADSHPEVCIVFVDLVGFTELSGRLGLRTLSRFWMTSIAPSTSTQSSFNSSVLRRSAMLTWLSRD